MHATDDARTISLGWGRFVATVLAFVAIGSILCPPNVGPLTWATVPAAAAATPAEPSPGKPSAADWDLAAKRMDLFYEDCRAALKDVPRDTFDPQAVVETVGKEPDALFAWVRDTTRWVPYRGVLRGAVGVLMDRAGNSADRSLLLAELLTRAGHEARIARGSVPAALAGTLLSRLPQPKAPRNFDPLGNDAEIEREAQRLAKRYDGNAVDLKRRALQARVQNQRLTEECVQQGLRQTNRLTALVGTGERPKPGAAMRVASDCLRDHFWVQVRTGATWRDLDPLAPDAKPGKSLVRAARTFAPDRLPANLFHTVRLRLIVETWANGRFVERTVLTERFPAHQLVGNHLTIAHLALDWPKALPMFEADAKKRRNDVTQAALEQSEWLPIIQVGDKQVSRSSFADTGTVNAKPVTDPKSRKLMGAGGRLGIFDRLGPRGRPKADSVLTAEWIEYELGQPGQPPRKARRPVFDLVGPAERASGAGAKPAVTESQRLERAVALLGQIHILPMVGWLSPEYVSVRRLRSLLANAEVGKAVASAAKARDLKPLEAAARHIREFPAPLYDLAQVRSQRRPTAVYLAGPNIITLCGEPRVRRDRWSLVQGFDIVFNDVAVDPRSGADSFATQLAQGVMDSVLETQVAAHPSAPDQVQATSVVSTSAFFEKGGEWTVVRSAGDAALARPALSADARSRIEDTLKSGLWVVVPKVTPKVNGEEQAAWWRVDPKSGRTLGMMGAGRGQTMAEVAFEWAMIIGLAAFWFAFDKCTTNNPGTANIWGCAGCALIAAAIVAASVFAQASGVGWLGWLTIIAPIYIFYKYC